MNTLFSRPPTPGKKAEVYILHIPAKARGVGICFAWRQPPTVAKSPWQPTTTPSVMRYDIHGTVGRSDVEDTDTESHMTTTTTESHSGYPTVTEGYNIVPVVVNDQAAEDYPAEDIAFRDAKFGPKTGKKGKKSGLVYKVGGKTFGGDQASDEGTGTYQGCWALDHVIVVNTAHLPLKLQDKFDPVDPSDWLMFPGAHFKVSTVFLPL